MKRVIVLSIVFSCMMHGMDTKNKPWHVMFHARFVARLHQLGNPHYTLRRSVAATRVRAESIETINRVIPNIMVAHIQYPKTISK